MPAMPPLLRIGPFSRLACVTIKTLRFYDSAGLFRPAWIDPRTGYRFYSATQLPLLRRIRLFRELGCSVAELRQLIGSTSGDSAMQPHATVLRRRLLVRAAQAEQRLQQLDALLAQEPATPASALPLEERQVAATVAFTIRDCVRAGGADIHRLFESAERQVARRGARSPQSPFLLLHDMDYLRTYIDVEVCVPVDRTALGWSGVRLIEPVARAACVQFQGSYAQAPVLFDAIVDSMQGTPTRIGGPIREVYLRFGADQRGYTLDPRFLTDDARQYRTELQLPLAS